MGTATGLTHFDARRHVIRLRNLAQTPVRTRADGALLQEHVRALVGPAEWLCGEVCKLLDALDATEPRDSQPRGSVKSVIATTLDTPTVPK